MESKKYLFAILLFLLISFAYYNVSIIENIFIENINTLERLYLDNPKYFMIFYFLVYILLTILSIPVALVLGLLSGFIFDVNTAVVIISFASSIGATGAMLLSRYIISDYVNKRFAPQVSKIKYDLNKNGTYYLFALRMSPIFPFFIINVAFGLTKIRTLAFYFVSQLGMLPGTIIIILIGSELDSFIIEKSPFSFELIIYLSILGLIPLAFKKVVKKN